MNTRINVVDADGTFAGWFQPEKAEKFEEHEWHNGANWISVNTRSQWLHETLYRTSGGRWVLAASSNYVGSETTYQYTSAEDAATWLLKNRHDDAYARHFGAVIEESGPTVREIGPAINVRLTPELLEAVDGLAAAERCSRAEMIRRALHGYLAYREATVTRHGECRCDRNGAHQPHTWTDINRKIYQCLG